MKSMTVIIPHSRLPNQHDAFTTQAKKICETLSKNINLKIIWVIFPALPPYKKSNYNSPNEKMIFSDEFDNIFEIFNLVRPDFVIVNGTIDFPNLNTILMSRFKKIPIVTLFFRNTQLLHFSLFSTLMIRFRNLFSEKKPESSDIIQKQSSLQFFFHLLNYTLKTLKKTRLNKPQSIIFILNYLKIAFTSPFPTHKIISGDINLCTNKKLKIKLISSGFQSSSIFVVGDPSYVKIDLKGLNDPPKIKLDKIKILFCPAPAHEHGLCGKKEEFDLISNVINKILQTNDMEVALKLHPSSSSMQEYIDELEGNLSKPIIFYQKENLSHLLSNYDIMLTYAGTTAITSSLLLQKPAVNLDFKTRVTGDILYYDNKTIIQCKSINSLIDDIRTIHQKGISKVDVKKFFQNYFGFVDGKSAFRASNIIYKLLKDKPKKHSD